MKLLEMSHVKKKFGDLEVLKDISVTVEEGQVLAIIGPSGSGKSTLLRCATMLETMDDGEMYYLGEQAAKSGASEDAGILWAGISELQSVPTFFRAEKCDGRAGSCAEAR